jgi:hypothetical protein
MLKAAFARRLRRSVQTFEQIVRRLLFTPPQRERFSMVVLQAAPAAHCETEAGISPSGRPLEPLRAT